MQPYGEPAVFLLLDELVRAPVPDLHSAGAVVSLGDLAFEVRVVERVILDVHREHALARLERDALRHRPRRQGAVELEPEVVVEPAGVVPLDDEDRCPRSLTRPRTGKGLRGLGWISLAPVLARAHEAFLARERGARLRCVRSPGSRSA